MALQKFPGLSPCWAVSLHISPALHRFCRSDGAFCPACHSTIQADSEILPDIALSVMAPKQQVPTHTVPSQLVWQLVKNYNSFLHKGLNGSRFSAEPGNLYNLNSYKYSGQC